MRPDLLLAHTELSRRAALGLAGKAAATAALASTALGTAAHADEPRRSRTAGGKRRNDDDYDDQMFDVDHAEDGGWAPSRYGAGDQRGTFNEVTPEKTAAALGLITGRKATKTYNLGELLTNGIPAYITDPPRDYQQRLTVLGYQPPEGFEEGGGILQSTEPLAANRVSIHEERFEPGFTYQIATQLDNLNHLGVGATFYNGFQGPDIAEPWGTSKLGNEHMGPIVTRGVLLDILGLKLEAGDEAALSTNTAGEPTLFDSYRITLEDIRAAMERGRIRSIEPGDVVLFRTGWNKVVGERERYLSAEPGIYLREARWLAARRPAIVGSDAWGFELLGNEDVIEAAFPVHQELLAKEGIRIGEAIITDELAADGVHEFVYLYTPQYAKGATAGSSPPAALAQPKR
ncbi:MAG: cyclase family protein [Mycobacteriales bacterium]